MPSSAAGGTLPREIESHVVTQETLLIALPENHRLTSRQVISSADVADEPWIVLPGGSGATLTARLNELASGGRFVPRVVATAADSATQLLMVDAGIGIALTFSGMQQNVPVHTVEFRPLEADVGTVDVRLAWRRDHVTSVLESLIAAARSLD